jgi:hypothetical protein
MMHQSTSAAGGRLPVFIISDVVSDETQQKSIY